MALPSSDGVRDRGGLHDGEMVKMGDMSEQHGGDDAPKLPFAPVTEAGLRTMLAEAEDRERIVEEAAGRYSVPAYHALTKANELARALYLRRSPRVIPPESDRP